MSDLRARDTVLIPRKARSPWARLAGPLTLAPTADVIPPGRAGTTASVTACGTPVPTATASARPGRCPVVRPGPSAEAMTNSDISAATRAPGSSVTAGCSRTIAPAILAADRTRSRPSATASCGSGSAGPTYLLASCRRRRITARRWQAVSPGIR